MSDVPIAGTEVRISADSHVAEPLDLWVTRFSELSCATARRSYDKKPVFSHTREGGWDPAERLLDMPVDNVTAEVLYPSIAATLFARRDAELAETIATIYNDWLIEYCQHAPERLWGVPCIPLWNIDYAVQEMTRCRKAGMVSAGIWLAPPPELPFFLPHYEKLWAAGQDLQMPLSMHINSGFGYYMNMPVAGSGARRYTALPRQRDHGEGSAERDYFIRRVGALSATQYRHRRSELGLGAVLAARAG